jgi:hypothetical protein
MLLSVGFVGSLIHWLAVVHDSSDKHNIKSGFLQAEA